MNALPFSASRTLAAFVLVTALPLASPVARAADAIALLPPVDAAHALSGEKLLEALRRGGFVLFVRHTEQTDGRQNDCNATVLTPAGIAMARRLGETLRRAAVPVTPPVSSPICRALHTAQLMDQGDPAIDRALMPNLEREQVEGRDRLFSTPPPAGRNAVMIGHVVGGEAGRQLSTEKGGIIVFRPDGAGGRTVVAHVLPAEWTGWSR
ncbi:MAG: histidine phosphatase family protein [Betaproteobacteria bacterium]|nr:histidine phosphatase family protein [Betaproteobacteria bacterium]